MAKSDLEAILSARTRRLGSSGRRAVSLSDAGFRGADELTDDPVSRVLVALLERNPQPLAELEVRARLPIAALLQTLLGCAGEFGLDLEFASLHPRRAVRLRDLAGAALGGTANDRLTAFSMLRFVPSSKSKLAKYVAAHVQRDVQETLSPEPNCPSSPRG